MKITDIKEDVGPTRLVASYYGLESRFNQLEEEMAELTQALCKYRRLKNGEICRKTLEEVRENIIEELGDILIVMDQILYLLDEDDELSFRYHLKTKIQRTFTEFKEKMKAEKTR